MHKREEKIAGTVRQAVAVPASRAPHTPSGSCRISFGGLACCRIEEEPTIVPFDAAALGLVTYSKHLGQGHTVSTIALPTGNGRLRHAGNCCERTLADRKNVLPDEADCLHGVYIRIRMIECKELCVGVF